MTAGCRNIPDHPCADAAELIRATTLVGPASHPGTDAPRGGSPDGQRRAVQGGQIKRFAIVPVSWDPGGYEITLTIKLKRHAIVTKYAESSRPVRQAWRDGTSRRS